MGILIVDDQPGIRLMLETILKEVGYTSVLTAASATEAFNLLGVDDAFNPVTGIDLVLMDISMPGINGIEACRRIKSVAHLKDLPIIMVTGLADTKDLQIAFAAGAVDYITKPPNIGEMLVRVSSALELKREMDRRKSAYVANLEEKNRQLELAFAELEEKIGNWKRLPWLRLRFSAPLPMN
jgi:DNA-binding response OmpR family regulator